MTTEEHHPPIEAGLPPARELTAIVVAAILGGVGVFMMVMALFYLTTRWYWFLGIIPIVASGILFFRPATGPERAETGTTSS